MKHLLVSQLFITRQFLRAVPVVVIGLAMLGAAFPTAADPKPEAANTKEVEVINDGSMPVPTYDVDALMRQPFQNETRIEVDGFLHSPLYTVPLGKRAVIETVTIIVQFPVSEGVGGFVSVETTLNESPANHYLVLNTQGTVLTSEVRAANHSVRLYADEDTQLFLNGAIQANSTIFVSLSGYLEQLP